MKRLILASNSPRRKKILKIGKLNFTTAKSNYKEESFKYYKESLIKKNSLYKALDVANSTDDAATVIGADTIVILDSVCLLKPVCQKEAFFMLKNLSGKTHSVVTAISLVDAKTKRSLSDICTTKVTFRNLQDFEIYDYLKNFKPYDKAGSYGIQDFIKEDEVQNPPKSSFICKVEGDYYNVMGISIEKLKSMLENFENST